MTSIDLLPFAHASINASHFHGISLLLWQELNDFTDSKERPDIGQDYEDDWEVVVTEIL